MRYLAVLLVVGIVCRVDSRDFHVIGGKYYYIENDEALDWFDARSECSSMDAHLVSIQNNYEWNYIKDLLSPYTPYWVDIRDVDSDYNWTSDTSKREAPFLKWSFGEPRPEADYDCVKLGEFSRNMITDYCSQKIYYICEANSRPVTAAPIVHHPSTGYEIVDMKLQ